MFVQLYSYQTCPFHTFFSCSVFQFSLNLCPKIVIFFDDLFPQLDGQLACSTKLWNQIESFAIQFRVKYLAVGLPGCTLGIVTDIFRSSSANFLRSIKIVE